jgi:hypothetical protein
MPDTYSFAGRFTTASAYQSGITGRKQKRKWHLMHTGLKEPFFVNAKGGFTKTSYTYRKNA